MTQHQHINPTRLGMLFRQAWIDGVRRHYPGEPKPAYVAPWEQMPQWEGEAAYAVCRQIRVFVAASGGRTSQLSREQRGRFVALCWIAQIHRRIPDPKPSYVADWEQLPAWQQETDADIFDVIEQDVLVTVQQHREQPCATCEQLLDWDYGLFAEVEFPQ